MRHEFFPEFLASSPGVTQATDPRRRISATYIIVFRNKSNIKTQWKSAEYYCLQFSALLCSFSCFSNICEVQLKVTMSLPCSAVDGWGWGEGRGGMYFGEICHFFPT
jgi:hypothetical protein